MSLWVLLGVGGAVGAMLRYAISGAVQRLVGTFPWGTVAVNVLGCVLMGALARAFLESSVLRAEYRTAILTGMLGALTTFSTFSYETLTLLNDGQWRSAIGYVLVTNAGCLLAVWAGFRVMTRLLV